jgi:predicted RNase H-like nuclease (RuvC/YqgF family)
VSLDNIRAIGERFSSEIDVLRSNLQSTETKLLHSEREKSEYNQIVNTMDTLDKKLREEDSIIEEMHSLLRKHLEIGRTIRSDINAIEASTDAIAEITGSNHFYIHQLNS